MNVEPFTQRRRGAWTPGGLFLALALVAVLPVGSASSAARAQQDDKDFDLRLAAKGGDVKRVESLLDGGMDVNGKGYNDSTALMYASVEGHVAVVKLLLARGATVDAQDSMGGTALMYAVWKGHTEVVRILVGAGADPSNKAKHGRTALSVAEKDGKDDILKLLKAARPQTAEDLAKEMYTDPKGFFKIRPPRGWRTQEYADDPRGKVAFTAPVSQTDLRVLAKAVDIPDYEGLLKNLRDIEKQVGVPMNIEPAVFNGMPALKRLATISSQGSTLKLLSVDLLVDGVSHNLQYAAPPDVFEKHRETAWKSMLTYEPLKRKTPASAEEARKHEAAKWLRLAKIAIEMGKIQVAKDAVSVGLEANPENAELKQMRADLERK